MLSIIVQNSCIDKIKLELDLRDLTGLTNGRIQRINVSKQHPLVTLMASQLSLNKNLDCERTNIIPAISVTPGNMRDEAVSMGNSYQPFFITCIFCLLSFNNKKLFSPFNRFNSIFPF